MDLPPLGFQHTTPPDEVPYPRGLLALSSPPELTHAGPLPTGATVAIVGTREPSESASRFAHELAAVVARAGRIVVSGGARGIDRAAHEGALSVGGHTCAVLPCGADHVYPRENRDLFIKMRSVGSTVLWPFPRCERAHLARFFRRNGVLVGLSDSVVVIQAGFPSGALNAASWAQKLGKQLFAVASQPWSVGWEGGRGLLDSGAAAPIHSLAGAARALGLAIHASQVSLPGVELPGPGGFALPDSAVQLDPDEATVLGLIRQTRMHVDEIIMRSGLDSARVAALLLTLSLQGVVVEAPPAFYCAKNPFAT